MKNSEIRDLTDQEIVDKIEDEAIQLVRLKMNHKITDLENPHVITNTRRLIARLKTEKRRRELAEQEMNK